MENRDDRGSCARVNTDTAERYLLDQMEELEKDEYEAHFFCCPDCAQALLSDELFVGNMRAVLKGQYVKPKPLRQSWWWYLLPWNW